MSGCGSIENRDRINATNCVHAEEYGGRNVIARIAVRIVSASTGGRIVTRDGDRRVSKTDWRNRPSAVAFDPKVEQVLWLTAEFECEAC